VAREPGGGGGRPRWLGDGAGGDGPTRGGPVVARGGRATVEVAPGLGLRQR
jgi:hypothetical protein